MSKDKEAKFLDLVERVHACQKCPRMNGSARVLGLGCGSINAELMFVGEAPGRLGADGSHLPFHGDKSGHNFESLIEQVGISRYDVFVTNSVLCNPKDEFGNNSTPHPREVSNCSEFLREQIEIVNPRLVVALGNTALKGCGLIENHDLTLKSSVRSSNRWFNRFLIPTYHPGQRAMMHRSFANQLADYQFVSELLRRSERKLRKRTPNNTSLTPRSKKSSEVARHILEKRGDGVSYFALHKLFFLSEVAHMEAAGERLTNSYVVRQKDGPYFVDLHLAKLSEMIPELVIEKRNGIVWLRLKPQQDIEDFKHELTLTQEEISVIDRTIERHGARTEADLKRVTYLTRPMRNLLRKERRLRVNLFNSAVLPYQELVSNESAEDG